MLRRAVDSRPSGEVPPPLRTWRTASKAGTCSGCPRLARSFSGMRASAGFFSAPATSFRASRPVTLTWRQAARGVRGMNRLVVPLRPEPYPASCPIRAAACAPPSSAASAFPSRQIGTVPSLESLLQASGMSSMARTKSAYTFGGMRRYFLRLGFRSFFGGCRTVTLELLSTASSSASRSPCSFRNLLAWPPAGQAGIVCFASLPPAGRRFSCSSGP